MTSLIESRLFEIFGTDVEEFKAILRDSDAIIAGSFPLQCILGENWNSDIDIFVKKDSAYHPVEKWFWSNFSNKKSCGPDKEFIKLNHRSILSRPGHPKNLLYHRYYTINGHEFDVITLSCYPEDFVKTFDINICGIIYKPGKDLVIPMKSFTLNRIGFAEKIISKSVCHCIDHDKVQCEGCRVRYCTCNKYIALRIQKYENRGFRIYNEKISRLKSLMNQEIRLFPGYGVEYFEALEHFERAIKKK